MQNSVGIIIICNKDEIISDIMYNGLNIDPSKLKGKKITELFIESDKSKVRNFINSIKQENSQFNWELNVSCRKKSQTLPFSGVIYDDSIILSGGLTGNDINNLYDAIMRINNSQVNYLRNLAKDISTHQKGNSFSQQASLDEMTKLNNELSNLQRKLMKKNIQYKELSERLQKISVTDELTRISNRRNFNAHLKIEWKRAIREKKPISIIIFDVDYFKQYNDTYGHPEGDTCLQKIARKLEDNFHRPLDLFARYGGDEFAVILPDTDKDGALHLAKKCHKQIHSLALKNKNSPIADHVTITLGVSTCKPKIDSKPERLIKFADQALYKAKEAGRNRVEYKENSCKSGKK